MDYTFKNSWTGKAVSAVLTNDELILSSSGAAAETIPFSTMKTIRLFRASRHCYQLHIYRLSGRTVVISNLYYLSRTQYEDRSRPYTTFVRILHMHLIARKEATFKAGIGTSGLIGRGIIAVVLSIILPAALTYFLPFPFSFVWLTVASLAAMVLLIFVIERNRLPQAYRAGEIPLDFLP